jgi:prepilin-type N-terminal cleavage/methylation domain-containing protein
MYTSSRKAFTLIELLVVIAVIAILSVVVILTLNPAELLRQSRDANRLSDLATLTSAINLYNTDQGGSLNFSIGTSGITYLSIVDPTATSTAGTNCSGLGLSGSYHCPASSTYRNVNGTGWIPVNFTQMSSGAPLSSLPIDTTNSTSSNFYYCYVTNGTSFEIVANPESQKYIAQASSSSGLFTKGSNQTLSGCSLTLASIATGTVAQANMKMSIASNTAFVDFGVAGSLTPYIGDELVISDHSGNQLIGWIKGAGTGETYGSQILPNSTFTTTSNVWTNNSTLTVLTSGCYSSHCLQVSLTSAYGSAGEDISLTSGMLVKGSVYVEKGTETAWMWTGIETPAHTTITTANTYSLLPSTWTQVVGYATAPTSSATFSQYYSGATSGQTSLFDSPSAVQVLTPSTTGVTIVSLAGGSTYNWTSEASGFNLNDPNGYTYSIVP